MRAETLLKFPWWFLAALAVGAFFIAKSANQFASERDAGIAAAMNRASAPVVDFDDLAVTDPAYSEAAFKAQIVVDAIRELREIGETNGHDSTLLPLARVSDTEAPEAFTAFIEITGVMKTNWQRFIDPFVSGEGALGPIVSIEGEVTATGAEAQARRELGQDRVAEDAVWVKPYRQGRQAVLAQGSELAAWGALPFYGISLFFAAMAAARFYYSRPN